MTSPQACRSCGEVKAIDAYERLPSGGHRGTCIACRRAANAATKLRIRQERETSPEYLASLVQRQRDKEKREARKESDKAAAAVANAAEQAELDALREARREAARQRREEREVALRDDIWSAMRRGRSRRALRAVQPNPTDSHRIKLKDEGGYISIAEMACRCAERDATHRAARSCKTFEAASAAVRILERPTPTLERTKELRRLWWTEMPRQTPEALTVHCEALEDLQADPFEEAMGDWGPAWMGTARGSWTASLAA